MDYEIDIDRLREDLEDYYGTAMFGASPLAVMDLVEVDSASDEELIKMARKLRIDLDKYILWD